MTAPSQSSFSPTPAIIDRLVGETSAQVLYIGDPQFDGSLVPVLTLPPGRTLSSVRPFLDELAPAPRRIRQTARLFDEASFIRHVREHACPHSRIFANPHAQPTPHMVAVYDYHSRAIKPVEETDDSPCDYLPIPRFGENRAVYPLRIAREWETWTKHAGSAMPPAAFAEFLEANVVDVLSPASELSPTTAQLLSDLDLKLASPSQLVALSRNLAINVDVAVRQAQTLSSGEIAITYVEQHRDSEGAPIRVPNAFLLGIPIFFGGPRFTILARLSYRVASQRVNWTFTLHRADEAREVAFAEVCERVAKETDVVVFSGSPEDLSRP